MTVAPTGVPRNVEVGDVTSGSVVITWEMILCIERNGVITDYTVVFRIEGGGVIPGEVNVMDRTFTASKLTPYTNYTFRVAGVNINGTGPHSNVTLVTTAEDSQWWRNRGGKGGWSPPTFKNGGAVPPQFYLC